jgi:putative transposase
MISLAHDRKKIMRTAVTEHPTAGWLSRQVTEAFPWETAPRYLLRDRDASFGSDFRSRRSDGHHGGHHGATLTLVERLCRARNRFDSPRMFGSHRDLQRAPTAARPVLVYRLLPPTRTHLSLDKDCPDPRPIMPPRIGKVIVIPQVGGLHHRYERLAA